MISGGETSWTAAGVTLAMAAVLCLPATAVAAPEVRPRAKPRSAVEAAQPVQFDAGRFSFTAPGRGLPAGKLTALERGFKFTPSGKPGRKALSIGVTSRVVTAAATGPAARAAQAAILPADAVLLPSGYNLGMSVGWAGFALSGNYSRLDQGLALGGREAVEMGLNYQGRRWRAGVAAGAERGPPLISLDPLSPERRYSVELGGAYSLTSRMALTGGVRYRLSPDGPAPLATQTSDESAYLGATLAF